MAKKTTEPAPTVEQPIVDDLVNPQHYRGDRVMQIIEEFELDFCTGNVVKYVLRAGHKPGAAEADDLRKAQWYIERRLAQLAGVAE